MSWSNNRAPLPPDWERRRRFVFARDEFMCQLAYEGVCLGVATEVDHIDSNADHRTSNLRAVCHDCHAKRSQEQASQATRKLWAQTRIPRPKHPGLL